MGSAPKIPAPQVVPPPPTPAMLQPKLAGSSTPNLGNTFLTQSMPSAAPIRKPQKTLLGE